MQSRAGYGAPASPPTQTFRPDLYSNGRGLTSNASYGNAYGLERRPSERAAPPPTLATATSDPATFGQEVRSSTTILIRRLSRTVTRETLASMLLFTRDLSDTEFVSSPYPEDNGYAAAHARFHSPAGAVEAQQKLHGKLNSTGDTNMIVEIRGTTTPGTFERRNTIDGVAATRTQTSSASSGGSGAGPPSRSRFGSAYHNQDASPPLLTPSSGASADFPSPETNPHFQSLFSPQSSLTNGIDDRHRSSGKYIINNDAVDDETGELLKDPVAYARNGQTQSAARRQTNPQSLVNRFNDLAVSTDGVNEQYGHQMSSHANGYQSPRVVASSRFPLSPTMSQNGGPVTSPQRPPLPPVNPADQNPPCNTLYVGNLPIDTSEDELKAVFSKQRGYKRLCFRTKQNGPMCFVEFEDVSFATKALNDLYGHPLHNSVKGGIRLSFSKNPLGVRSGQTNGMAPHLAMSPHAMAPGYGMSAGSNFSSVSGPPPGLSSPPGLVNANGHRAPPQNHGDNGMFANPFGMPTSDYSNQMHARGMTHGMSPAMNATAYPRDHRLGYSDYAVGRY